jgi:hypothetical protein
MMLVRDEAAAELSLRSGSLSCPACSGRLRPWGYARVRTVRLSGGGRRSWRPRRAWCSDCAATQVLLSASCLPRRQDEVTTIGSALQAHAVGHGHRRIASSLGVPADTVRGWLRAAKAQAEELRCLATRFLPQLDPCMAAVVPRGSALADAVEALGLAAAAAVRRLGYTDPPWQIIAAMTRGQLLTGPLRT